MLRSEGYATDPAYSQKLQRIMKENGYQTGGEVMGTGGAVNVSGSGSYSKTMVSQSQEMFAKKIAESVSPVVIPIPMGGGGGGGGQAPVPGGVGTSFPNVPSEASSLVAMEYKLKRVTWGDSV